MPRTRRPRRRVPAEAGGAAPPAADAGRPAATLPATLLRRPLTTAAVLLTGAAVGAALPFLRPVEPMATADLLLATGASWKDEDVEAVRFSRQQANLARLPVVARDVAVEVERVGGRVVPTAEVEDRLEVTLLPEQAALRFTYRSADDTVASAAVAAAVDSYRDLRATQLRQQGEQAVGRLDALARSLPARTTRPGLLEVRERLARERADAVLLARTGDAAEGVLMPTRMERPTEVSVARGTAAGALAAVFPALLVGRLLGRSRDRQQGSREARRVLAVPMIAEIKGFRARKLPVATTPMSVVAQSYLMAAGALPVRVSRDPAEQPPLLAVVDASPSGVVGSTVTANLALAAARVGHHVMVVVRAQSGAADLLARHGVDGTPVPEAGHRPGVVDVLQEGTTWAFAYPWDLVLVDAPAVLASGESLGTAQHADAAVVAVPAGISTDDLALLRKQVQELELPLSGYLYLRSPFWAPWTGKNGGGRRRRPRRDKPRKGGSS